MIGLIVAIIILGWMLNGTAFGIVNDCFDDFKVSKKLKFTMLCLSLIPWLAVFVLLFFLMPRGMRYIISYFARSYKEMFSEEKGE